MGKKEELRQQLRSADLRFSPLNGARFDIVSEKDEFTFDCKRCGKCCKGRGKDGEQILVSPLDIYNGAKELGITAEEFIDKYVNFHTGRGSGMMIGTLASDYKGTCKLLTYESGLAKCKIHKSKPLICALHPLGIIHGNDNIDEDGSRLYIMMSPCKNSQQGGHKIKVSDITGNLPGTAEEIQIASDVRSMHDVAPKRMVFYRGVMAISACLNTIELDDRQIKLFEVSDRFRRGSMKVKEYIEEKTGCTLNIGKCIDDETYRMCVNLMQEFEACNYAYSYSNYDTSKPFLEQCKANLEEFKEFIIKFTEIVSLIFDDITSGMSDDNKKIVEEIAINYGMDGIDFGA